MTPYEAAAALCKDHGGAIGVALATMLRERLITPDTIVWVEKALRDRTGDDALRMAARNMLHEAIEGWGRKVDGARPRV